MAGPIITWAWKFEIHVIEKAVLVAIADDADKVGTSRYLGSLKTIGKQCSLSSRQIRRSLRRLEIWGLIRTYPQHRMNGSDTVHIFHALTEVDPAEWNAAHAVEASAARRGKKGQKHARAIMSTFDRAAFWQLVQQKVANDSTFHTWLAPLKIVVVETNRLVLRVPDMVFADPAFDHKPVFLAAAKEIQPTISKLHIILPADPKTK